MAIKLLCKLSNGDTHDLTKAVSTITWSGDYKSCSRKLNFSIISNYQDKNFNGVDIPLSSLITFYEDGVELFKGFIWEREKSNTKNTMSYLAYDYGERLNKIKVSYNFKNETPPSIVNKICNEYGLKKGNIASSSVKIKKVFLGVSIYNTIMTAYTEDHKKTNKKYMLHYKGDKLCVSEKGIVKLKIGFEEGKNIVASQFKESISSMVNKVLIVDESGSKVSEVKDDAMLKVHGLFQEVYRKEEGKDAKTEAKSLLNGVEQTCTLSGFGDTSCITGCGVHVKDKSTGLTGLFYIDSDTHTWTGENYTIDLDLNFKNVMHEVSSGQDEQKTSSSNNNNKTNTNTGGASVSGGNQKLLELAKSKLGCKYVWGAVGPNTFDCSGLTSWIHKQMGISIPRTSLAQSKSGKPVSKSDLQVGDLVFFKTTSAPVGHVGVYVGNGQFIHAPNKNKPVKYDSLSSSYYSSRYVNARRYW